LILHRTAGGAIVSHRFYTPTEVAEMLKVSSTTVMKLIHDGRLPAIRVSERIYRIPEAAFVRFQAGDRPDVRITRERVRGLKPLGGGEELPDPAVARQPVGR